MTLSFDKVTITDPLVEYRKVLSSGVLVIRIYVGDDPTISSFIERLRPTYGIESYSLQLSEVLQYIEDAKTRMASVPRAATAPGAP